MDHIVNEIWGTYNAGFPYAALMLALAAPDVCASLEVEPGSSRNGVGLRYKDWYNRYLAQRVPFLTADDVYSLRCGVVHEGRLGNDKQKFEKVVFSLDDSWAHAMMDDPTGKKYISITVRLFCENVVEGVREWFAEHHASAAVSANMQRMFKYHTSGVQVTPGIRMMVGAPCIS
jgi:hypothetical protein